jgi:FkbM family methyltransferase
MSTITIQEANFVDRMVNGKHRVKMPEFLAKHDSFDNWEPERFDSMELHLRRGQVLFDVGAETGHISAIYARFVGPENMVMFESNPDNWQNIKATWDAEGLADPRDTICALVGTEDVSLTPTPDQFLHFDGERWPLCALTGKIWTPRSYRYLHEHYGVTPRVSIDGYVEKTGNIPSAITIDVEGAELEVLRGARKTLGLMRPTVWVSLHEDLMRKHYKSCPRDIHNFMDSCGYGHMYLATDHEIHMMYVPR